MLLTQIVAGVLMSTIALAVSFLIFKLVRDTLKTIKNKK
jgi:hypothetical protein